MSNSLDSKIVDLLSSGQPLKAKDIAHRLGVESKTVNSRLYSSLSERVIKDNKFRWSLIQQTKSNGQGSRNDPSVEGQKNKEGEGDAPSCPSCSKTMRLRMARVGPNKGKQFWGCSDYPRCKDTLPLENHDREGGSGAHGKSDENSKAATDRREAESPSQFTAPVEWREGKLRTNWISEYLTVGAVPSLLTSVSGEDENVAKLLSQTLLLRNRNKPTKAPGGSVEALLSVAEKILLRGDLPLVTDGVETSAIYASGIDKEANYLRDDESIIEWEWAEAAPRVSLETLCNRAEYSVCDELAAIASTESALLDSELEERFIEMVAMVDESLPHWLTPQVPIANLLKPSLHNDVEERRVDFLFSHPCLKVPLVIEIDGDDHVDSVDQARDRQLEESGYSVLRIPNEEIENEEGASLDRALHLISRAKSDASDSIKGQRSQKFSRLLVECTWAAKLQLALVKALQLGWLKPAAYQWRIHIDTPLEHTLEAVRGVLELLTALEGLYEPAILPEHVIVQIGAEEEPTLLHCDLNTWRMSAHVIADDDPPFDVHIALEPDGSPWSSYPRASTDLILRPSFSPVRYSSAHAVGSQYDLPTSVDFIDAAEHLRALLQIIFRKEDFREGQAEAVFNALKGDDCIILLPTGGGKSIIYQLSGLISPGITLVIDPLVSLIEDQVRGLRSYGINRAVGVSSAVSSMLDRKAMMASAEKGEFIFLLVAPERMQSPAFRDTLRAISHISRINLAVIDEAHCVSEWGHDFRPAYLNLARNIRKLGEINGATPTLFALTGTASRAVLRDMVADLELDTNKDSAIIRPKSFDRKELEFRIIETDERNSTTDFGAIFMDLPRQFDLPRADFFTTSGRRTSSGVVFTSFAKGPTGVFKIRDKVRSVSGASTAVYSGGPPLKSIDSRSWNEEKRENARRFMENECALLVATKAYGMGIDKPNIRYTVHFGMPGSLEAFYQEAGRAGRDRRNAVCYILFSRPPNHVESQLDLLRKSLSDLHQEFKSLPRNEGGDLRSALFFHLNSFTGAEDEVNDVKLMLSKFDVISEGKSIEFPLPRDGDERKREEKGLFRLVQLGVLSDYEIDYGRYIVRAVGGKISPKSISERILSYVRRSDSGRVKDIQRQLAPFEGNEGSNEDIINLVRVLISYCYDTIERARRRSIFEAIEAAKHGRDPSVFRRRLLNYLQEGMDPESFQLIVEADEIDFSVCVEILRKVNNRLEAGELRGITIRFLESYPEHPSLLILRALSESLCEDCDASVVLEAIRSLFVSARIKYSLDIVHMEHAISLISDFGESRASAVFGPLLLALDESDILLQSHHLFYNGLAQKAVNSGAKEIDDILLLHRLHSSIIETYEEISLNKPEIEALMSR
jgi:ATP-dependent DNA helicase RecQ